MRYDLVIIGAGPVGIGVAVEARFSGIPKQGILVLKKDVKPGDHLLSPPPARA